MNTLAAIADRNADFRSLGDVWADTTTSHGRLMLAVLGGLAEFERDLIRQRTAEGRERAKERGVKLGRRPKLTSTQRHDGFAAGHPRRESQLRHDPWHDRELVQMPRATRPLCRLETRGEDIEQRLDQDHPSHPNA